ncbi:MAG: flagellar basal-body rod protein FlgB [Candidatus Melainabacteria bacterium GWF2_32_7]|nr:MAG: flagellar basal-body rod protein FlgB [Candidatus Melainabacteria bacterium GWF2_32_7]
MELISNNPIEASTLALNALSSRHNALAANIANADTPGYKRVDVKFEDQLVKIIEKNTDIQKEKEKNSAKVMNSANSVVLSNSLNYQEDLYKEFKPEISETGNAAIKTDGNNVNIEYEMAELAKNGTKYAAITTMQEKMFSGLRSVIEQGGR